jgi:hypothetical protein
MDGVYEKVNSSAGKKQVLLLELKSSAGMTG